MGATCKDINIAQEFIDAGVTYNKKQNNIDDFKLWKMWKNSGQIGNLRLIFRAFMIINFKFFSFVYECFYFYFMPYLVFGIVITWGSLPTDKDLHTNIKDMKYFEGETFVQFYN